MKPKERYLLDYNIDTPVCRNENCNNSAKFISYPKGFQQYCCKKCSDTCRIKIAKGEETSRKNNSKQVTVEKRKKTWLGKYGVENISQSTYIQKKRLKTISENDSFGDDFNEKRIRTNQERFGVDNIMHDKQVVKQMKLSYYESMIERYGTDKPMHVEEIKNKKKQTQISNGNQIPDELLSEYELYCRKVRQVTNRQPLHLLENYELRGVANINGAYQLDHIISVQFGFLHEINPSIIGNLKNLQMIPALINLSKGADCWCLLSKKEKL